MHRALLLVPFPDRNDEVQAGMLWKMGHIDPAIRSVTAECGEPDIVGRNDRDMRPDVKGVIGALRGVSLGVRDPSTVVHVRDAYVINVRRLLAGSAVLDPLEEHGVKTPGSSCG